MATTILGKWLTDAANNKFAPKTFMGQVMSDDGTQNLNTVLANFGGGDKYSTTEPTTNAEYWLQPYE